MRFLTIAALFCSSIASASICFASDNSEKIKTILEQQDICGSFVRYDDQNLYMGFSGSNAGAVNIASLSGGPLKTILTKQSALDVVTEGNSAFILTPEAIEEWELSSNQFVKSYETYAFPGKKDRSLTASSMARYQDKIIIAHARLGASIFNLKTKRLVNQFRLINSQLPLESSAEGVTVHGKYAYIVMDNYSLIAPPAKAPFRGVVIVDMESEQVVAELDGLDPGVTSVLSDDRYLLVSFGGIPIWKYDINALKLNSKTLPEPLSRLWQTPLKGHPVGIASVDDKYYYTCFLQAPSQPGENGGYYRNVPKAMERALLGLD